MADETETTTAETKPQRGAKPDDLAQARARVAELEAQLAAADRDRAELIRQLDERRQRQRPVHPELISTLVDLWRATNDARYLDAVKAQGEALLAEVAPTAPSQG